MYTPIRQHSAVKARLIVVILASISAASCEPRPTPEPPTPLSGFEVVASSIAVVAPLSTVTIEVPCPGGKIAISAGYQATPLNPALPLAARGLEIHESMPDGGVARVTLTNANVFESGTLQAFAVCINPVVGLRVDANPPRSLDQARCTDDERVIGGGYTATAPGTMVLESVPTAGPLAGGGWNAPLGRNSFAPPAAAKSVVALCVPKSAVAGWTLKESEMLSLGAQSSGTLSLGCDQGMPIAAGAESTPNIHIDFMAFHQVSLTLNGGRWSSTIWNKDLFAGPGAVRARMRVICAQVVP